MGFCNITIQSYVMQPVQLLSMVYYKSLSLQKHAIRSLKT
jgi:hypothetical protein